MDKTDKIKFTSYRFPGRTFLLGKKDLIEYRRLEKEIIGKEIELIQSIQDKEIIKEK